MKKYKKEIFIIVFACLCVAVTVINSSAADVGIFEAKAKYDIYLQGSENELSIIADVEILRFVEILDRTFLVVRPADFTLSPKEGFILFESVRAILPNERLKFQNAGQGRIKF